MSKPLDKVAKPIDRAKMWAIAQGYLSPDGEEVRLTAVQNGLKKLGQSVGEDGRITPTGVAEACAWLRTGLPLDHPDHLAPEEAQKVAPL